MCYKLTPDEEELYEKIKTHLGQIKEQLKNYHMGTDVQEMIDQMGEEAHKLHKSLKEKGHEPKHHAYMIVNRGMDPDNPKFYKHVHPVEDLIYFIQDPHANDDPEDKTIGEEFEFSVYSRRFGHEDTYNITRTKEGWYVQHMVINGSCDKEGTPYLYDNFNQDSIEYPFGLGGWLQWLWDQAASCGLSTNQVQEALNELAEWVSNVERGAPSGGVWEGFSEKTKPSVKTGVITFLDVLGWKGVYDRKTDAIQTLKKLIGEIEEDAEKQRGKINFNVEIKSISDTIVIFTACLEEEATRAIEIHGLLCKGIIPRSIELEIPVRGATTFGEFDNDGAIFVGKAVDEAASWHEQADWIGVHLTPSAEYIFENNGNDALWINCILPTKGSSKRNYYCVNWKSNSLGEPIEIRDIKSKFLRLGPILPEIAGKFANTLDFIEKRDK